MEFRILGPLEVSNSGEPVAVGPRKQRLLLALLVINANRVVTTDRILEELLARVQLAAEVFFFVSFVQEAVALSAEEEARRAHFLAVESFAEPLVGMARSRDQMMIGRPVLGDPPDVSVATIVGDIEIAVLVERQAFR